MTTLISKLLPPFCHEWQRVRVSSRHLVNTRRASISILIIIIVLECLGWLGRRRGRLYKATKASLPSSNTIYMGVHLIQFSKECIKKSIHVLKLCHDRIKSNTSRKSRGSEGGWSWSSGRSYWSGSPRMKLCLALFNSSGVNGTHNMKEVGNRKGNREMA